MKPSRTFPFRLIITCILVWILHQEVLSQTCTTGKVDVRLTGLLNSNPGMTLEQIRGASITRLKDDVKGPFRQLPEDSVKRITITNDNIKVNLVKASVQSDLPVVIHFHSGGFIKPLLPSMEYEAMRVARKLNAVVFDVDYRVAPEHKFPTAADDAYRAFIWIQEHAKEFGGDPSTIILSGIGSGANLAALTIHKARKEGKSAPIRLVILRCPPTDNPMISYYPSWEDNANGYLVSKDESIFNFQTYLDKTEWYRNNPAMWPIYEKDFAGLPPHLIITAEFDVLRDEGIAYGKKLEQAGNAVAIKCFPHQLHALQGLPENAGEIQRVYELMRESLAASLSGK